MVWGLVRFRSMARLDEVKGPGLPRNCQYSRLTGACGRRKLGCCTDGANEVRWKGDEV